jgi:hypothetical protein
MAPPFQLVIAEVAITIETPEGVEIVEDAAEYAAFLGPAGSGCTEVALRLNLDRPPDTDGLPTIFDSGGAWRALADGEDVLLVLQGPPVVGTPLAVLRLASDGGPSDLHCGPALVGRESGRTVVVNPLRYPLDQLLLMCWLATRRGVIAHAAGFRRGPVGALFAGVSGAGKSTLTRLLEASPDLVSLSDDRLVVRGTDRGIRVFGTPWPGEAGVAANDGARLGALVVLRQAAGHGVRELGPREALERLLPTLSIPWYDPDRTAAALEWFDEVLREVPAFELSFARDPDIAGVVADLLGYLPG